MGSSLSKVLAISQINQRRAVGDRRVLFVAAALPIMLILVIGFVGGRDLKAPLGIVVYEHGPFEARLVRLLESSPSVEVRIESSKGTSEDDVLRGVLLGSVVVPSDFDTAVSEGRHVSLDVMERSGNSASYLTQGAVAAAYDVLASEWATARTIAHTEGTSPRVAFDSVGERTDHAYAEALDKFTGNQPGPYSYTTAANLVLFVFLTLLVTSSGLVEARRVGLTRRMLASPTPVGVIVVGQLVSNTVLALAQGIALLAVGKLVFGVRWGDLTGVLLVLVVIALAASGASVLLGTLARSQEQAVAVGIVAAVAFGMLGGCMWNLDTVGPLMRTVGHIGPQAWAMDAFVRLIFGHSGITGILPDTGVLALFALGLLTLGALRLRSVASAQAATA